MTHFDAIIIGAGQAGPPLASRLASEDYKVAIVERKFFGGTCVNTGCTPTKAMVASAKVAHTVKHASAHGVIGASNFKIDFDQVKKRRDEIVMQSREGLETWMEDDENITVFKGQARFINNKALQVDGNQIQAEKIFINVGGRARIANHEEGLEYLTNSSILNLDELPEHLVIIGGSYVGVEFAQMFRRFGCKVTIIEKGEYLLSKEDHDVSENVKDILEKEGIHIRTKAECIYAKTSEEEGVEVEINCDDGDPAVSGSHLLYAVGRVPNTDDLGLENTDIEVDGHGYIKIDDYLNTTVEGVWALGDCNGKGAFTHTAYNDFEIVENGLFGNGGKKVSDRISCYALYMDPPLARVGMTAEEVIKKGIRALKAEMLMSKVARANEKGETEGFMKVIVDAESHLILGASILGVGADEIIHSIIDVMYAKQPYTVMKNAVHIHPTVSELIPTMLSNLKEI
ncbi:FAD-containing oxidoreductase [Fulvivirga sediminis]|uniref:FAD-containing oxidoreductase n=1 Tax=Fulvivirga sediminis TaxID=2803949 RepID=A0A937F6Z0_9BACT|nr:FAD-containing oxidoreductase [Fulvivirga sediminis]MBL3656167.1 FAD-containing oxidoreductase [Fulvivirga sediminis]